MINYISIIFLNTFWIETPVLSWALARRIFCPHCFFSICQSYPAASQVFPAPSEALPDPSKFILAASEAILAPFEALTVY